jgi:phosphoglycerate dehydrogenase-like enzyme
MYEMQFRIQHRNALPMRVLMRAHVFRTELIDAAQRLDLDLVVADDPQTFAHEVPRAEALWIVPSAYDATVAEILKTSAGTLRWIGMTSIGYDPLVRFGIPDGVIVTNVGDVLGPVVAEHAVMLLLAMVRQLPAMQRRQSEGRWDASVMRQLRSLEDLSVTIVGFGSIGREIASRLRPFGAHIIGVRASGRPDALADEMFPAGRLRDGLARGDAVVLAVPLVEQTRHLIDETAFAAMRPGALLVNVARGPVIDGSALVAALENERLGGVALDVTDPEPLPAGHPMWNDPRVVISPHIGGFGSIAAGRRLAQLFERNVAHLRSGEPLEAQVTVVSS